MTRCVSAFFAFAFALPAFAGDPKPGPDPRTVVRYGPAYKYPQDGWIVLHIEGEPYERGYQHGRLMAMEIAGYLKSLSFQQSTAAPADAWNLTRTLVSSAFLRKIGAEYLEEMKGTADGAAAAGATIHGRPVDLLDIACANCSAEYDTLESALDALPTGLEGKRWPQPGKPKTMPKPAPDHCSAFAATGPATKGGQIVFGHITMWTLYSTNFYNVWLDVKPAKGHRVLMQSFPGGIWSAMDYYLSDSGLMLTETTIRQTRYNADGIPLADRARRAMQYGRTIDDVVRFLSHKNNGLYANEWLIGDANTNEIAVLELGTNAQKLRRSSKNEWIPGGMPGFYWGCNNTKDLQVRLDTYASLNDRPHDISWRPSDRDKAWLTLLQKHHGKIDADFGKLAFTTPPLAAHPSLDAKVTTGEMVKQLKTVALFGPPLGRTWQPTFEQRTKYSDILPLVSNDWTVLTADAPNVTDVKEVAVDLSGKSQKADADSKSEDDDTGSASTTAAWTGTLLPKSNADIWLTAGFAHYERIVALEQTLKEKEGGTLSPAAKNRIELQLFRYRSDYRSSISATLDFESKTETEIEIDSARRHKKAVAYGVLTLQALRKFVGDEQFLEAMTAYGRTKAGQTVTADDFIQFFGKGTSKDVATFFKRWENNVQFLAEESAMYHVRSFWDDLERTMIVYGTLRDTAANKDAAGELQRLIREKWSNVTVPVIADIDLTETQWQKNHLLLIGGPSANQTSAGFEVLFPKMFQRNSFTANGEWYGHPGSAVMISGSKLYGWHRSFVILAGNSANATWHMPAALVNAPIADLVVLPNGGAVKAMIRK